MIHNCGKHEYCKWSVYDWLRWMEDGANDPLVDVDDDPFTCIEEVDPDDDYPH